MISQRLLALSRVTAEAWRTEMVIPVAWAALRSYGGRYVREKKVLTLMEALSKITLLPARRLEQAIPRMKKKGRLQVGVDADITVSNPDTIRERATYKEPYHHSEGIETVFVNGTLVLDRSRVVEGVAPGEWLRHPYP